MKPFAAVQALLKTSQGKKELLGSCFRLEAPNYYITTNHCIENLEPKEIEVMNAMDENNDIPCVAIHRHPKADIAMIEVEGKIPDEYEKFQLISRDSFVGTQVHCFGMLAKGEHIKGDSPVRTIGGIIQRDFHYKNRKYEFLAFELASPIPKGMSGGPAFIADKPHLAVGVAIGAIESEIVVAGFTEYENNQIKERERISKITQYGVILRLKPLEDWLKKIMNNNV